MIPGQIPIANFISGVAILPASLDQASAAGRIDFSAWTWPLSINLPLFAAGALYCVGLFRLKRRATMRHALQPWPPFAFFAGWLALLLALDSPIHELGEQLFWVHMSQHEILVLIAAPLLVLSRPFSVFLWAIPKFCRQRVASFTKHPWTRRTWVVISAPAVAWSLHAAALWVWHAPALFNLTLVSDGAHALQHLSFFGTALLFWWALVQGHEGKLNYGTSILYVFTTAIHTSALGALLTFASHAFYAPYALTTAAWRLTALQDQQIGGLIMWIPAGTLLVAIGLWMVPKWLKLSDRRWDLSRSAELIRTGRGVAHEN
jgi:putative membrane protein